MSFAYAVGVGLILSNDGTNFFGYDGAYVLGTFNWRGGVIRVASTFSIGDQLTRRYRSIA